MANMIPFPSDEQRTLYAVYSEEKDWRGTEQSVEFHWFYDSPREKPPVPYHIAIKGWHNSDRNEYGFSEEFGYTEGLINELFTRSEAEQLLDWLKTHYPDHAHKILARALPVDNNEAGVSCLPVGGTDDFYMLYRSDGYDLPFQVMGYFYYGHIEHRYLQVSGGDRQVNIEHVTEHFDGDGNVMFVSTDDIPDWLK